MPDNDQLTLLLQQAHAGDGGAADLAYAALYPELLKIARARLRVHQAPTLLDTQSLVHESFLRFIGGGLQVPQSRKHFYAYAAKAMRNIVIDFVRRAQAGKRGAGLQQVTFDTALLDVVSGAEAVPGSAPVADLERALAAFWRTSRACCPRGCGRLSRHRPCRRCSIGCGRRGASRRARWREPSIAASEWCWWWQKTR